MFEDNLEKKMLVRKWVGFFSNLPAPFYALHPDSFTIIWNPRMRSRAGLCNPSKNRIELNSNLLQSNPEFESTLVHELCHLAIIRRWPHSQSHGAKWKSLMSHCGFEPARCHNLTPSKRFLQKRWSIQCKCQTHSIATVTYHRIQKGRKYRCKKCFTFLVPPKISGDIDLRAL